MDILPCNSAPVAQSSPFLSLPAFLRKRIYLYAGLVSDYDHPIDLNFGDLACDPGDEPFQISYNLLLTCRIFYNDVQPIIYSTNEFYIRYRDMDDLESLQNLSPKTLALLTRLTIYLESCGDGFSHEEKGHAPLDLLLDGSSQEVLLNWQEAASHLISHIKPLTLRLSLLCDSANIERAKKIVEPLRAVSTLANCWIRLGRKPNHHLQATAQEAAMRAIGHQYPPPSPSVFRYFDLPPEIRLNILQYTDLVTPTRNIEWSFERKFGLRYNDPGCKIPIWRQISTAGSSHICQFRECRHDRDLIAEDYCQSQHAAFSANCHCWAPPASLLMVSKAFQEDAQAIFYAKNRFVIANGVHEYREGGIQGPRENRLIDIHKGYSAP
jgi:hypothetical protein